MAEDARALRLGLAHRQPADGVAVESQVNQPHQGLVAQILVHAALHDAEEEIGAVERSFRALRPAHRQPHRAGRLVRVGRVRRAFVERHRDVGVERALDAHRFFRRQEEAIAVDRRGKVHALLGEAAQRTEAEHLEAARIGQQRRIPSHEAVQAAVLLDHVDPRAQPQVESVAEDDLGAGRGHLLGRHRFHTAVGAHRHERRGVDAAVRQLEHAAARLPVAVSQPEIHLSMSIASP